MDYDDAYANAAYIPGADGYIDAWAQAAQGFRAQHADWRTVAYGSGDREKFDLFLPQSPAKGLVVFVHGGYWLRFDRSSWSHLAAGSLARGWAVAMPSYDLAPAIRISGITRQIAAAITHAASLVAGPVALAGHSAGGHLVARMACPGVLPDAVAARLTRVVSISPVGDLRPLMKTAMNTDLKLDEGEALAESPTLQAPLADKEVTVWVGADERPVFLDQAAQLAQAWDAHHVVAEGRHHFDVIAPLAEADSALVTALLGDD